MKRHTIIQYDNRIHVELNTHSHTYTMSHTHACLHSHYHCAQMAENL